jgi:hypothetical protein
METCRPFFLRLSSSRESFFAVMPAEAGIQALKDIARFARDLNS